MKEIVRHEPVSEMGASLQSQAHDLLKSHLADPVGPLVVSSSPQPAHKARAERGRTLLAKAMGGLADLLKAQVKGYTKKDGTVVNAYANKTIKGKGDNLKIGGAKSLWKAGHQVQMHAPGHELHGFSGALTGKTSQQNQSTFFHVKAADGREQALNAHDLKPAAGHHWPDVETGHQEVKDSAAKKITEHPNYHPDDHAALQDKGYSDGEIAGIWDKDTANNGGQPTGGNSRADLKLPTQDQPDGQPGPAAKKKMLSPAEQQAKAKEFAAAQKPGSKAYQPATPKSSFPPGKGVEGPKAKPVDEKAKAAHHATLGAMKDGESKVFGNSRFKSEKLKVTRKGDQFHTDTGMSGTKQPPRSHEDQAAWMAGLHANGESLVPEDGAGAPPAATKPTTKPTAGGAAGGDVDPKHLDLMASSLANDEDSSDDELHEHFTSQGVPEEHSKAALAHRDAFLTAGLADQSAEGLGSMMAAAKAKPGAKPAAKPAAGSMGSEAANAGAPAPEKPAAGGDVPREAQPGAETGNPASGGDVPPHADAQAAGWDNLPDSENPKHALSGLGSKDLGRLATMPSTHAHAYAHQELANRGLDSDGNWKGFEGAQAHHASGIPKDFKPAMPQANGPEGDPIVGHLQTVHGKVLQAAAKGHLDLQGLARSQLAGRGHDVHGNWVGFQKAAELHGKGGKKPSGGGGGTPKGPQQPDLFKALRPGQRPMLFIPMGRAEELAAILAKHGGGSGG